MKITHAHVIIQVDNSDGSKNNSADKSIESAKLASFTDTQDQALM